MTRRIILLISVIFILTWLVVYRYEQLRIEALNTRFFNNAKLALTVASRGDFDSESSTMTSDIMNNDGNLLPYISHLHPDILPKALIDPFIDQEQTERFLQLRYGFVNHNYWTPPVERISHKPTWFVWSNGFTQENVKITENIDAGNISSFHFLSAPYDPTNGHESVGYLYADATGAYAGKIK